MRILLSTKISKSLSSTRKINQKYGELAKPIISKLNMIKDITDYRQLRNLPGNFHELKYQAENTYAVTLKHPHRLVMRLCDDRQSVCILDVVDYHDNSKIIASYN